ncbi:quinone oxidoreductase family protein [Saccharothrix australiensis]|uniref:NADPH:quinone reductase-like Zn-dependent oxidoreductase n=1 Tax=Saccharothrix australiensis TaxID=2072 RepID=A0A495W378_9PSEU|nr:zinc-binding dehydrogenase [Saccharothrix australiensis]RKT55507.1 NADPH:quinone reductase-like Zn-dependent oxidoreductase [Saccharothrix australiensis]
MKAIRFHELGGPEVLRLEEVPDPTPGAGEVLVRVSAAGISYAEVQIRSGAMAAHPWFPAPPLPFTPGFEVAGTVAAVGEGVDGSLVGTRVVGGLAGGGYAERAVLAAGAVLPVPGALDDHRALALFGQGATAVGVIGTGEPRAGEVVLVLAAAGGVGSLLVQLAKRSGATVVAAAGGGRKLALAEQLGADLAVDYTEDGWAERVRAEVGQVHLLLDPVGGAVSRAAFGLLAIGVGRAVVFGSAGGELPAVTPVDFLARGLRVSGFGPRVVVDPAYGARLRAEAFRLGVEGVLNPVVGGVLPLSSAAAAHALFEERGTTGKIVLVP